MIKITSRRQHEIFNTDSCLYNKSFQVTKVGIIKTKILQELPSKPN